MNGFLFSGNHGKSHPIQLMAEINERVHCKPRDLTSRGENMMMKEKRGERLHEPLHDCSVVGCAAYDDFFRLRIRTAMAAMSSNRMMIAMPIPHAVVELIPTPSVGAGEYAEYSPVTGL
jgi:hypothetical protein